MHITNKMIKIYLNTPIEKYPESRALDILDELPFGSHTRQQAFNLFMAWLELRESEK